MQEEICILIKTVKFVWGGGNIDYRLRNRDWKRDHVSTPSALRYVGYVARLRILACTKMASTSKHGQV